MTLEDASAKHDRRVHLAAKGIFVALCCALSATMLVAFGDTDSFRTTNSGTDRIVQVVGAALLLASLAAAIRLGSRCRQSESWAVLAYGSWMTSHCMFFLLIVLESPNFRDAGGTGIAFAVASFAALCGLIWGGLRSAFRGRWREVLRWWFGSLLLIVLYVIWGIAARPE